MKTIINYFLSSISRSKLSLDKKAVLVEKPWVLIDSDGEIQKLIFKDNKGLILSKNGNVSMGTWEYFPEAKALYIDRGTDKILLKEQYIDENVLILKKDGTQDDFFALANENTIPDYDIPSYLNALYARNNKILQVKLLDGNYLWVYDGLGKKILNNCEVNVVDHQLNKINLEDGKFLSDDKKNVFIIKNRKIVNCSQNELLITKDGIQVEIENNESNDESRLNSKITINGIPVKDTRLAINDRKTFIIKEGIISSIVYFFSYELTKGYKVSVEQKNFQIIEKGDKIISSEPIFPLPNGRYRIRGEFWWIKVKDNVVV